MSHQLPQQAVERLQAGIMAVRGGDLPGAARHLEAVVAAHPASVTANLALLDVQLCLLREGDGAQAGQLLDCFRVVHPFAQQAAEDAEEFAAQRRELISLRRQFSQREGEQAERQRHAQARSSALDKRQEKLAQQQASLKGWEDALARDKSALAARQAELDAEAARLLQREKALERQEREAQKRANAERRWAEAAAQRDEGRLNELRAQEKDVAAALDARLAVERRIEQAESQVAEVQRQLDNQNRRLEMLPDESALKADLADLQSRKAQAKQQVSECERLQALIGETKVEVERLVSLSNGLPALRAQQEALEQYLAGAGQEATLRERGLEETAGAFLSLAEETLGRLRPEVRDSLLRAESCEREMIELRASLQAALRRYENVEPELTARREALSKYLQADQAVAQALGGVEEAAGAEPLLRKAEDLLAAADRALRLAIEANAEAKALETLRPGGAE